VRIWEVKSRGETELMKALKEHKGTVTCIRITRSDEEVLRTIKCLDITVNLVFNCMCSSVLHQAQMERASFGT